MNFELPIRSLSILFLFGAIIAILWFPDNPATPDLAYALFYWFVAFGIVRWVESGINNLLHSESNTSTEEALKIIRYVVSVFAFFFFVLFLVKGIQSFVYVLGTLLQ